MRYGVMGLWGVPALWRYGVMTLCGRTGATALLRYGVIDPATLHFATSRNLTPLCHTIHLGFTPSLPRLSASVRVRPTRPRPSNSSVRPTWRPLAGDLVTVGDGR